MSWDLRSKREIEDSLKAVRTASVVTARLAPQTMDMQAFQAGYLTALRVVAEALGVDPPENQSGYQQVVVIESVKELPALSDDWKSAFDRAETLAAQAIDDGCSIPQAAAILRDAIRQQRNGQ